MREQFFCSSFKNEIENYLSEKLSSKVINAVFIKEVLLEFSLFEQSSLLNHLQSCLTRSLLSSPFILLISVHSQAKKIFHYYYFLNNRLRQLPCFFFACSLIVNLRLNNCDSNEVKNMRVFNDVFYLYSRSNDFFPFLFD